MIKLNICRSFVALVWENWIQFQHLSQYCRTCRTEGHRPANALETIANAGGSAGTRTQGHLIKSLILTLPYS